MKPVNKNPDGLSKIKDFEEHVPDPDFPSVQVSEDVANEIRKLIGFSSPQ